MKKKIIIAIGVVMILVGVIIGASQMSMILQDPGESARYTLDTPASRELDKGDYDIWIVIEGKDREAGDISIKDDQGNEMLQQPVGRETKTPSGKQYLKVGTISVKKKGTYHFTSTTMDRLYLTPPQSFGDGLGTCALGILISIVGILIIVVVAIMPKLREKEPVARPPPPPPPPLAPDQIYEPPPPR